MVKITITVRQAEKLMKNQSIYLLFDQLENKKKK